VTTVAPLRSEPPLSTTDGRIAWSKQITARDAYNGSCNRDHRSNCPYEPGPDYDFGSSAILLRGGERLLAGQKSGIVYALDATKSGAILWQTRVGEGGTNGGVQWGMATDGEHVYATTSDVGRTRWTGDPRCSASARSSRSCRCAARRCR